MNLILKNMNGIDVMTLFGRLDISSSPKAEEELKKLILKDGTASIIIDLTEVENINSSGLKVFVTAIRMMETETKKIKLCGMNNEIRQIFEVTELIDRFEIHETLEDAVKSFS